MITIWRISSSSSSAAAAAAAKTCSQCPCKCTYDIRLRIICVIMVNTIWKVWCWTIFSMKIIEVFHIIPIWIFRSINWKSIAGKTQKIVLCYCYQGFRWKMIMIIPLRCWMTIPRIKRLNNLVCDCLSRRFIFIKKRYTIDRYTYRTQKSICWAIWINFRI